MEHALDGFRSIQRDLNTIEHMLYVSCKFTRTTEMLRKVMETIVSTYENFFSIAYEVLVPKDHYTANTVHDKIQLLNEMMIAKGVAVDLSDYFILKRLLISDYDSIGEYRKNLCMVSYLDGEEYILNLAKLLEFFENLKLAYGGLTQTQ